MEFTLSEFNEEIEKIVRVEVENDEFILQTNEHLSNNSLFPLIKSENETEYFELPQDMKFNDGHLFSIIGYSILFVLSAYGNLSLLFVILKRRRIHCSPYSRIDFMLLHLAIADLIVTFFMMPLEIAWAATVSWRGGDILCRITSFFRIYGLFLSSFVLVCLAIDRYCAVKYPMKTLLASVRRGRYMIGCAWFLSFICSFPQIFVFHVERHPIFTFYTQCVDFNAFPRPELRTAYLISHMLLMYVLPLIIIFCLYLGIVTELIKQTKSSQLYSTHSKDNEGMRRSGLGNLGRARVKTIKMSVTICLIFFIDWTPYFVMCLWYWIDQDSASLIDPRIQKALFLFASTNSTFNPIVYGIFHLKSNKNNNANANGRPNTLKSRSGINGYGSSFYSGSNGRNGGSLVKGQHISANINHSSGKFNCLGKRFNHLNSSTIVSL